VWEAWAGAGDEDETPPRDLLAEPEDLLIGFSGWSSSCGAHHSHSHRRNVMTVMRGFLPGDPRIALLSFFAFTTRSHSISFGQRCPPSVAIPDQQVD
jgi:hypothetical protein